VNYFSVSDSLLWNLCAKVNNIGVAVLHVCFIKMLATYRLVHLLSFDVKLYYPLFPSEGQVLKFHVKLLFHCNVQDEGISLVLSVSPHEC
jgi:hypothetical protein